MFIIPFAQSSVLEDKRASTVGSQPNARSLVPTTAIKNGAKSTSVSVQRVEVHRKEHIEESGTNRWKWEGEEEREMIAKVCLYSYIEC